MRKYRINAIISVARKAYMKKEDQNTEYKQSWREEYLKWI